MNLFEDGGWDWVTSASASGGVLVATASGGYIVLSDPTGAHYKFNYGTVGGAIGKAPGPVSFSFSTANNFSTGNLYCTGISRGRKLVDSDIEGFCLSIDASGGGGGNVYSGSMMLLGIPYELLNNQIDNTVRSAALGPLGVLLFDKVVDWLAQDKMAAKQFFQSQARAVLLMGGQGYGWLGVGVGASMGYMSLSTIVPNLGNIGGSSEGPGGVSASSKIVLPGDVLFDFDKSVLKPEAMSYILRLIGGRPAKPKAVVIYGHTDSVGDYGYNLGLSGRRASAVAAFLIAVGFAAPGAITTMPMGATQPIDTNATEDGRRRNRRVEIEFY
jgi:outer membrane protein OmpA-like peptidoglycan-associated protein